MVDQRISVQGVMAVGKYGVQRRAIEHFVIDSERQPAYPDEADLALLPRTVQSGNGLVYYLIDRYELDIVAGNDIDHIYAQSAQALLNAPQNSLGGEVELCRAIATDLRRKHVSVARNPGKRFTKCRLRSC